MVERNEITTRFKIGDQISAGRVGSDAIEAIPSCTTHHGVVTHLSRKQIFAFASRKVIISVTAHEHIVTTFPLEVVVTRATVVIRILNRSFHQIRLIRTPGTTRCRIEALRRKPRSSRSMRG
jgi:hypothetical protein